MNNQDFQPGQCLYFTTNSILYRDIYEVKVSARYRDRLDLFLSYHNGYLVIPPVGTIIRWVNQKYNEELISYVIDRDISQKVWSVSLPRAEVRGDKKTRVLAIGSGKGGVGKSTFSINLALALRQCNKRVILLDADVGMANIAVLLGIRDYKNIGDVIKGECDLASIIYSGPGGIDIIPGSSGLPELTRLNTLQFNRIISGFTELEKDYDYMIIDTGAGLSDLVLKFLLAADEMLLITNPDPHALLDAYALVKVLADKNSNMAINLVINKCDSRDEGVQCGTMFTSTVKKYLNIQPKFLGWLPFENYMVKSVKDKEPLLLSFPHSNYSHQLQKIIHIIVGIEDGNNRKNQPAMGLKGFWSRLKKTITG